MVFDCYRPIQAVDDFVAWTGQGGPPDPRWVSEGQARRPDRRRLYRPASSHSRGSTVDLALAPADAARCRSAGDPDCGAETATLDFGTGFDCSTCAATPPIALPRLSSPIATGCSPSCSRPGPRLFARMVALHAERRAPQGAALRLPSRTQVICRRRGRRDWSRTMRVYRRAISRRAISGKRFRVSVCRKKCPPGSIFRAKEADVVPLPFHQLRLVDIVILRSAECCDQARQQRLLAIGISLDRTSIRA